MAVAETACLFLSNILPCNPPQGYWNRSCFMRLFSLQDILVIESVQNFHPIVSKTVQSVYASMQVYRKKSVELAPSLGDTMIAVVTTIIFGRS